MSVLCSRHWSALRTAVDDRGLGEFVAASGPEVALRLDGGGFEPLMAANLSILSNAIGAAGPDVLMNDGCPLCWLTEKDLGGHNFDDWINHAADEQLSAATALGLLPGDER